MEKHSFPLKNWQFVSSPFYNVLSQIGRSSSTDGFPYLFFSANCVRFRGVAGWKTFGKRRRIMSAQTILIWIVIGGIAGILAEAMVGGLRSGLIGAIVVGILGAIMGGWLFGVLGLNIGAGIVGEIIKALIGAVVLLLILRAARRL
jgi:uncharacterized membrane protein YeaQ/YmgE (transglycosylase-associated protein family)